MSVDIPQDILKKSYFSSLKLGDVFLKNFEGIDHQKFFIVAGMTDDKLTVCSVFINSNIHPSLYNKQLILNAQVPLKKNDNTFLSHDSFANCSHTFVLDADLIINEILSGQCEVIGNIAPKDLRIVRCTIVNSGFLKQDDEEFFFKDLLSH